MFAGLKGDGMANTTEAPKRWVLREQLKQIRKFIGLEKREVSEALGVPPAIVNAWEEGVESPTTKQLYELSRFYKCSIAVFLEPTPLPPLTDFRSPPGAQPEALSRDAKRTILEFEEWCRRQAELESLLGRAVKPALPETSQREDPQRLAQRERERLGLGYGPLKKGRLSTLERLWEALAAQGVKIFAFRLPPEELSGYSRWHPELGPCILLNRVDSLGRKAFTLAHEYAHLLLREDGAVCRVLTLEQEKERFANQFAAAFLVPLEDFSDCLVKRGWKTEEIWDKHKLESIAQRYGVSWQMIAIRLEEIGGAPRGFARKVLSEADDIGREKPYQRPKGWRLWKERVRRELGLAYCTMVYHAYTEGLVPLSAVLYYMGLPLKHVKPFLKDFPLLEKELKPG
jgi:Zn-dependent peptidase ImmA (M78 family)/DNA-binding XRE family transcriptional regulator